MPYRIEPLPKRLRIYQQNLNKTDKAHYDLINSPIHKDWDILLLQEPYCHDSFIPASSYLHFPFYPSTLRSLHSLFTEFAERPFTTRIIRQQARHQNTIDILYPA
ncbi:hypothetical protein JB92DRAFT_3297381 [Gautieria morchelliformis]|nr:hypothetical protein JB92DRAFT_3297381 [Gautieria morchelliformis]